MNATPIKLKTGEWGARVAGSAKRGDELTITAKSGKTWTAIVDVVVWSGNGVSLCALLPTQRKERAPRASAGCWVCPACEEENSSSARTCWECGCSH